MIITETILTSTMCLLLTFQAYSLVYCLITKKSPIDTHYGFSLWGFIPIVIISTIIGALV